MVLLYPSPPLSNFGLQAPNRESIVAQGPVLRLGTVTSDEDGTYVCAAVNTLGERLLPVKVEVQGQVDSLIVLCFFTF